MTQTDQRQLRERAFGIWEKEGRPEGKAEEHWHRANAEESHKACDEALDGAIDDSFPASDPPAIIQPSPSKGDKA